MPELPEVQTILNSLVQGDSTTPSIIGQCIQSVELFWHKTISDLEPAQFINLLINRQITTAKRRGKYLNFEMDQNHLIIHLRMSGDLIIEPNFSKPGLIVPQRKHDRVHIVFENGYRLAFNDTRKFGRIWLTDNPEGLFSRLGPDPLDASLSVNTFYSMLSSKKRQIKPLLLDQSFLAGLGNIYTDEALFLSRINPLQRSDSLTKEDASILLSGIRSVLNEGIKRNGASIDWVYRGGQFQNYFKVYQKTGQNCVICKTPIKRIVVGQRGTHFCPECQPLRMHK
ncbi:MAG: bifunctional DNA-formamidopyrimidine glycosylase/DNA-(apurinic or apyrimidinic site) lyase [Anaerolineaceae bacterium]|nr:bifunctional DNA-formamidopyrimidine glycosylase/DNA-(apurinic or apyrimidinic site) lyase [Anaerolineaceae bacterium]